MSKQYIEKRDSAYFIKGSRVSIVHSFPILTLEEVYYIVGWALPTLR